MTGSLGIALVGPGAIAIEHLRAFAEIEGTDNSWVVGRKDAAVAEFAEEWGFANHGTDLELALRSDAVDVVVICSPNTLHTAQAAQALRAGKHVIVEIPMAMSHTEASDLVEIADRMDRTIQVCHTMRSFEAITYMRDLVGSGTESVSQVTGFFAIPRRDNQGFLGQRSWVDDLLWHHACHLVDAALWVTSTDAVHAPRLLRGRTHPTLGMTMDLSLAFSTGSEQVITHALTYNTSELIWQIRFVCDSGQYVFDNGRLLDNSGGVIVAGAPIRDLSIQNRAMLTAIRRGVPGDFDARSALLSLRCLQELQDNDHTHSEQTSEWE